jgi:hypothetical protein
MNTSLPNAGEKQLRRTQWKNLYHYAASSLLKQFPFLDPKTVHGVKKDHLSKCYCNIDWPLQPVYMRSFTDTQKDKIKKRWHALRYARIDLMRQLGGEAVMLEESRKRSFCPIDPHCLLIEKCLDQFLVHIKMITDSPPQYYKNALQHLRDREKGLYQTEMAEKKRERYLTGKKSKQLLLTEQLSFMLAALLETAKGFPEPSSLGPSIKTHHDQQHTVIKGGDAYELDNTSENEKQ